MQVVISFKPVTRFQLRAAPVSGSEVISTLFFIIQDLELLKAKLGLPGEWENDDDLSGLFLHLMEKKDVGFAMQTMTFW